MDLKKRIAKLASSIIPKKIPWFVIPVIVFVFTLLIYLKTMSSSVFWGDSGELTAAVCSMGVAQWPGYPLYIIVGKLFSLIPLGSIASRLNFMSVFFGASAVAVVYLIVKELADIKTSLLAAIVFATSYTFWSQATIAEVYTLSVFLMCLSIYRIIRWSKSKKDKDLFIFCLIYGMAVMHHISNINLAPAFIVFILWNRRVNLKLIATMFLLFMIPFSLYLYLPISSSFDPAIDWGNPENIGNFIDQVGDKDNHWRFYSLPASQIGHQFRLFFVFLLRQFPLLIGLSLLGVYYLWGFDKKMLVLFGLILVVNIVQFVNYYTYDLVVHFLPSYFIFALLIGFGGLVLLNSLKQTRYAWILIGLLILLKVFIVYPKAVQIDSYNRIMENEYNTPLVYHLLYPQNLDKSRFYQTELFAEYAFSLPDNSTLLCEYDDQCFVLWYYQICEGKRPDMKVVYRDLLELKWYNENLNDRYAMKLNTSQGISGFMHSVDEPVYYVKANPVFLNIYNESLIPLQKLK
ncbi:MAG: hypothetical protein MAG795_00541 [Candidatus Woesearchaeota archaeon]|nr:hypothetical protein [Candidatus Woesearchaeota archaeon]